MQSSRALGIFALSAVILAAISFAAVDVVVANVPPGGTVPGTVMLYALIGTLALLASVVPAIHWFVRALQQGHDAEIEPIRLRAARVPFEDDDL